MQVGLLGTHKNTYSKQRLNIALINTWKVVNSKGGTEKVFCDLASALVRKGHNVSAICLDKNSGLPAYPLDSRVIFRNAYQSRWYRVSKFIVNILSLRLNKRDRDRKRLDLLGGINAKLILQKIDTNIDCIISFQAETTYALKPFIKNTPIITMIHLNPEELQKSCSVFREALYESNIVQCLMPEFINVIHEIEPDAKVICIPNSVPQYKNVANRSSKVIINVARFDRHQKRQDLLVKAFILIHKKFPNWSLEFWGEECCDEEFVSELKSIVRQNNLDERIKFCGTSDYIEKELRRASIFAFPSKFEGFGIALGEAMSMGLPSIGCKSCAAVNTLIKNNINGILCNDTPESMAESLSILMSNEELRVKLGNEAKKYIRIYSQNNIIEQWERLLYELVEENNKYTTNKGSTN